jgi:hypothetical protein
MRRHGVVLKNAKRKKNFKCSMKLFEALLHSGSQNGRRKTFF